MSTEIKIEAFIDNAIEKQRSHYYNLPVYCPDNGLVKECDYIVIMTKYEKKIYTFQNL